MDKSEINLIRKFCIVMSHVLNTPPDTQVTKQLIKKSAVGIYGMTAEEIDDIIDQMYKNMLFTKCECDGIIWYQLRTYVEPTGEIAEFLKKRKEENKD